MKSIQQERIEKLNNELVQDREYILYWMQTAQRSAWNHALQYAIGIGDKRKKPVLAVFGLTADYPEANLRHYVFMLEGLKETQEELSKRNIQLVVQQGSPDDIALKFSSKADLVVVDEGYLHIQRKWRSKVAQQIDCQLVEVTTNLIVPIETVSDKENFSAGTLRPRITKKLEPFMIQIVHQNPKLSSLEMNISNIDLSDPLKTANSLKVDPSVSITQFKGGTSQAKKHLKKFIEKKLDAYDTLRNDPSLDYQSNLSPYLHFGQISPLQIALAVRKTESPGKDAFLEELIVRRELSHNFIYYNKLYDQYEGLPPWALRTLNFHKKDKREYVYSKDQFEKAQTHDPYWNAAQMEMVLTGKMHGYMRMYWGKKILEWTEDPKEAFQIALYLNNKYELDGRDPNGFTGVAWCFGKHDRAWNERPVFGKVRYMNANGLKRKFDIEAYVKKSGNL